MKIEDYFIIEISRRKILLRNVGIREKNRDGERLVLIVTLFGTFCYTLFQLFIEHIAIFANHRALPNTDDPSETKEINAAYRV